MIILIITITMIIIIIKITIKFYTLEFLVNYVNRRLTISRANCFWKLSKRWIKIDYPFFMKEMLPDIWPSNNSTNFLFLRKLEKSGFFSIWPNWKRLFLSNRVNVCQSVCFKPMQTHFACNKDAFWTGGGVFHPHCWRLTRISKPISHALNTHFHCVCNAFNLS